MRGDPDEENHRYLVTVQLPSGRPILNIALVEEDGQCWVEDFSFPEYGRWPDDVLKRRHD